MAKISFTFRCSVADNEKNKEHELSVRLTWGKHGVCYGRSGISIKPSAWNTKAQKVITPKFTSQEDKEYREAKQGEIDLLSNGLDRYKVKANESDFGAEWLKDAIRLAKANDMKAVPRNDKNLMFDALDEWIEARTGDISLNRLKHLKSIVKIVKRFILYTGTDYKVKDFNIDVLNALDKFMRHENEFWQEDENGDLKCNNAKYESAFKAIPQSRIPKPRSENTMNNLMVRLTSFFIWCRDKKGIISVNPFDAFEIKPAKYGKPIFITKAERDSLYNFDFSAHPNLAVQRDIFIFQSFVGCRVGDLYKLTWDNIIDDVLYYTPTKTKNSTIQSPEIPLSDTAKTILNKYRAQCRVNGKSHLLPFISMQKYNVAIKRIFKLAGLTREVPCIDTMTRDVVNKPLYEVATSHMARKNFVGILDEDGVDQRVIS
jgi:integrase